MRRQGSILVGLLWCVAILSVVVISVLHSAHLELRTAKNQGDQLQAHYLALAGIEKAQALLFLDARQRRGDRQNHTGALYDDPANFRDLPLGRGQFRVLRQGGQSDAEAIIYGISDEESRLNVNYASAEELGGLKDLRPEVAAAIIDYRDRDSNVTQGGAEAEEYAAMQPPYKPRNAPLRTLREMLMVRNLPRDLLLGEDANLNGLLDPEEDDGDENYPPDNRDGRLDAGWSGWITVASSVRDVNAAGESRVNVQEADERDLANVRGFSQEIARAIVQSRGQNRLESLADLLEVRATPPGNQPPGGPSPGGGPGGQPGGEPSAGRRVTAVPAFPVVRAPAPQAGPPGQPPQQAGPPGTVPTRQQPSGPPLISEQLLMDVADDLTVLSTSVQAGAVNLNTAPVEVLECLPGMTRELAEAVVRYRSSSGYFPNIAWLLKVDGLTRDVFKSVAPRVTARSETFRILSEGLVTSTGARKRIQVVVRVSSSSISTLSYRENL
jgi:DNA uptake protein ComE-like DNA-binding protein